MPTNYCVSHLGSQEESHGHFILSYQDGGFIQVGETGFLQNSAKLLVVKTDENGNLSWEKEFNKNGHNLEIHTKMMMVYHREINENSALIKLNKTDGDVIFNKY